MTRARRALRPRFNHTREAPAKSVSLANQKPGRRRAGCGFGAWLVIVIVEHVPQLLAERQQDTDGANSWPQRSDSPPLSGGQRLVAKTTRQP